MTNYINLLFLSFLNKLGSFLKFAKNSITFLISNTFAFRVNNTINKNATQLFSFLLT